MTPAEFRTLRKKAGLSQTAWGRALGYAGANASVQVNIAQFESGKRKIPPRTAMVAELLVEAMANQKEQKQ